eukprot:7243230-Prymnesium_polylepis.2
MDGRLAPSAGLLPRAREPLHRLSAPSRVPTLVTLAPRASRSAAGCWGHRRRRSRRRHGDQSARLVAQ